VNCLCSFVSKLCHARLAPAQIKHNGEKIMKKLFTIAALITLPFLLNACQSDMNHSMKKDDGMMMQKTKMMDGDMQQDSMKSDKKMMGSDMKKDSMM